MNRLNRILGAIALVILPSLIFSQEFYKTYNTQYDRTARDIMKTSTGEYLIIGASNNSSPTDGDLYVMRTGADGTFIWDTVYGGAKPDYGYSMTDTDDGNFIVTGYSQSRPGGGGDYDIYLLKLNSLGKKLNEKWVDFSGKNDEARAVIRTAANEYFVIGSMGMPPSSTVKSQMVLLKIDKDLNVLHSQEYGGSDHEYGLAICETSGGLLIAGQTMSEGAGGGDAIVMKLTPVSSTNYSVDWSKTFGNNLAQEVVGVAVSTSNANMAMLAIRDSVPGAAIDGNIDIVLKEIDLANQGAEVGTEDRYWGDDKDTPKTIRAVSAAMGGGYIVGAISRSWWPDSPQMWLIRTKDDGQEIWKYDYGLQYEHDHCHMIKEDAGGFIAVGHQRVGVMKVAFLKINSSGTVGIKESGNILSGVRVFPNPSTDGNVSLSFANPGVYQVEVTNLMGQQIEKNVVNLQQAGVYSLQLSSTGAGIYIVNIRGEQGSFTARLIVE